MGYRGRLAPSPTGYMHLGHARTFAIAADRARAAGGALVLRIEDLDGERSRPEYVDAWIEDLRWFGIEWNEGPGAGGGAGPYFQSLRHEFYLRAFEELKSQGLVYPCNCSRKDILAASSAPHAGDEEPLYPGTCRSCSVSSSNGERLPWRFRVPDGEVIRFVDGLAGARSYEAGRDFGDFVVWRRDGLASYQLAVVVDDSAMGITEVVRGADLLVSSARQILIYRALRLAIPGFAHVPLVTDGAGTRLAKRHDALSLRSLRALGWSSEEVRTCSVQELLRFPPDRTSHGGA